MSLVLRIEKARHVAEDEKERVHSERVIKRADEVYAKAMRSLKYAEELYRERLEGRRGRNG